MSQHAESPSPSLQPAAEGATWVAARPEHELAAGELATFKHAGQQLVLIRTEQGQLHALDNRCPHEGYPLAQGELKGCALTCCWHNWKFDVRDGACLIGGEAVRSYPTRVVDGMLEVDLRAPDPALEIQRLRASLDEGLARGDVGRTLRDAARLLQAGLPARELLWDVARHDARHAEYGSTHVLAVAAEGARLARRYPGTAALHAIAPALDLCAETNRRLPLRERPAALAAPQAELGAQLAHAVEQEQLERALALLAGALEAGAGRAQLERLLLGCVALHFTNFGHELIYLCKIGDFLEGAPRAALLECYSALLESIVLGTREDSLPYMQPYTRRFAQVADELEALAGAARDDAAFDAARLRDLVLDGSAEACVEALTRALREGVEPERLATALVAAAARRLWRFDERVDRDPLVAETWLWATHRFTFASAVRDACRRWPGALAQRLLLQAVAFVHSGRAMDRPAAERHLPPPSSAGLAGLLQAIGAKQAESAQAALLGLVRSGAPLTPVREALEDLGLQDPMVRPIFVAHALKTTIAAFDEAELLPREDAEYALAGAVRFLATPIAERRVHEAVDTTLRWVIDGKMPRKLTQ